MLKFKNFLKRSGLDEKPFQTECFEWCLNKEQATTNEVAANEVAANEVAANEVAPNEVAANEAAPNEVAPNEVAPNEVADEGGFGGFPPSGILALEMGLGKTIIMLGLIECNFQRHTLIILPLVLLAQWEKCIKKYFGHQPLIYHGSRPKSLLLSLEQVMQKPIVLTTYGQISLPSEKQIKRGRKPSLLNKIPWDRIICDEAHHVSHKSTNEFKGVKSLSAKIRWLVTGTPIQNSEQELYNLFALLGFNHDAAYYNEGTNYTDAVKHFIFHKTKAGVGIQIPTLHEHTEIVQWENESERQFSSHIHSLLTFCNVPKQSIASEMEAEEDPRILRMKYLSKSRQVCIYPPMLKTNINHFEKILKNKKAQTQDDVAYENYNIGELYVSESKINAIVKTLTDRKGNGCGKIVFCHYYAEIDALEKRLKEAGGFKKISKFDGRIKSSKVKQEILDDPTNEVLLAQIKMCQEGLNLQENYSEVYFTSPHFNPAAEDQAIARCWRIGQQKEVFVFRYIMIDTEHNAVAPNAYSIDTYSAWLQSNKREKISKMEDASHS